MSEAHVNVFELYDLFAAGHDSVADVFEYVPQEPYASVKDARDQLEEAAASWDDGDAAQYAVYTADGSLAGYTGLFLEWDRRTGRIGFILGKSHWGNGYAGECATALTDLAFDRLDLDLVAIGYEEGNERSERAIERFIDAVGGQYDGVLRNWTPIGTEIADHHRYTVTREQYERSLAER
ncbi:MULTISPECIES: GNAT family N-acetyltransferase [Natrialbaceae]|uniref:GNAT family N-acetyltransferase n=1 Tax=Natrialbaceae TaxID=1644061 RepID=UPI00207CE2A0|nr:GNAT family N-acetyltransferase [Natronococcus sp. CG52]